MNLQPRADGALDYFPCRYGTSKLLFRGPRRRTDTPYVAILGGSETYGRFVERPYPARVEQETGQGVVNLGYINAGVDVFLQDRSVMELCRRAEATVIQILGAQNLTNRFYSVHARRNDRFLKASQLLGTLYRDMDFAEISFTRHLLVALQQKAPERFPMIVEELQAAWLARMRQLLGAVGGRRILLWIGEAAPGGGASFDPNAPDPLFVTRSMIDTLSPLVSDYVEVVGTAASRKAGLAGMVFRPGDETIAATAPNAAMHEEVAAQLAPALAKALA